MQMRNSKKKSLAKLTQMLQVLTMPSDEKVSVELRDLIEKTRKKVVRLRGQIEAGDRSKSRTAGRSQSRGRVPRKRSCSGIRLGSLEKKFNGILDWERPKCPRYRDYPIANTLSRSKSKKNSKSQKRVRFSREKKPKSKIPALCKRKAPARMNASPEKIYIKTMSRSTSRSAKKSNKSKESAEKRKRRESQLKLAEEIKGLDNHIDTIENEISDQIKAIQQKLKARLDKKQKQIKEVCQV